MSRPLTRFTWERLCRSALDEDRLTRWVARLSDRERRAFWAGILLLDGAASVAGVVEGWAKLDGRAPDPEPEPEPPAPKLSPAEKAHAAGCKQCHGDLGPYTAGGRPRAYCSPRCKELARQKARRSARLGRETGALPDG